MQIATVLYDMSRSIPIPCRWGEYTVLAIEDAYLNGLKAKLLTLSQDNAEGLPEFPIPKTYYNEHGSYILPRL